MPRLPSARDVPTVRPGRDPGASVPGISVPNINVPRKSVPSIRVPQGAFDSTLGIAAEELAPGVADVSGALRKKQNDLEVAAQRQQERQDLVDRADKRKRYKEGLEEKFLESINRTGPDISSQTVLEEYGQFASSFRQELMNEHIGSEDSAAALNAKLIDIESEYTGKVAAASVRKGNEKIEAIYNDEINSLLKNVTQSPTPENIDSSFKQIENNLEELKNRYDPAAIDNLRSRGREDISLGALNSILIKGKPEEAELLFNNDIVFSSLKPENQRTIQGRIQGIYNSRKDVLHEAAVAGAVERAKLSARRENISLILNDVGAEQIGMPGVGESAATITPFAGDEQASTDAQDAARMFSASRRLLMAGESSLANGMLSQARFIIENSSAINRQKELDKPISEDFASELGLPVGTTLRQVMGIIPASPEEQAESTSAARTRGRMKIQGEEQIAFVDEASTMINDLLEEIKVDPTIVGVGGSLRSAGQTATQVLGDLGADRIVDMARDMAYENTDLGMDDISKLFDSPTLSTLSILENSIGLILARIQTPEGRISVDVIKRSIDDVGLTGLKGSKQVENRLSLVLERLNKRSSSIESRFNLPKKQQEEPDDVPRFKIENGVLVPIGGQ